MVPITPSSIKCTWNLHKGCESGKDGLGSNVSPWGYPLGLSPWENHWTVGSQKKAAKAHGVVNFS